MQFPNFQSKHDQDSMINPEEFIEYLKTVGRLPSIRPPEGVILCYQGKLLQHIKTKHKTTKADGFLSNMMLLDETDGRIGVLGGFGIGAPAAVVILEELIAFGVKKFISIGTAGTLQDKVKIGDLIVCDRAIRDEGTSHHYLPPSKYSYASKELTSKIEVTLAELKQPFQVGTSWTIDSPYRETVAEARHYKNEEVITVEMEASALFAVAAYRKVQLGAVFTISDSLAELKWKPEFHSARTKQGLETLYQVAVRSL